MKICTIRSVDLRELLYIHTENFIEIVYEPCQYVLTSYKLLKMVKIADYRDLRLIAAIISFYICRLFLHQLISMKFPACISN